MEAGSLSSPNDLITSIPSAPSLSEKRGRTLPLYPGKDSLPTFVPLLQGSTPPPNYPLPVSPYFNCQFKTHGHASAAKNAVWHISVLFTGTPNSPFSTPCISIATWPISIKFTYFMPSIYATLHTKFEKNRLSSSRDVFLKISPFFFFFLFFTPFYKSNFEPTKVTLLVDQFLSNLAHL